MTKYAICIGINDYAGVDADLNGCVNDARDWVNVLTSRGFTVVSTLTDKRATKANIMNALKDVLIKASGYDAIIVTYSGHGTWVPDKNGDEEDGKDEALCPYDCDQGQLITDDELFSLINKYRARNVRVTIISDSCHSGTVSRLKQSVSPLTGTYAETYRKARFLPPEKVLDAAARRRLYEIDTKAGPIGRALPPEYPGILLMSGCQDHQYSYDAKIGSKYNGAFTYHAIRALKSAQFKSYNDWHKQIRLALPSTKYPQNPNLVGTEKAKTQWPVA